MDLPRKVLPEDYPGEGHKSIEARTQETDENRNLRHFMVAAAAPSPSKKTVLTDKNGGGGAAEPTPPWGKPVGRVPWPSSRTASSPLVIGRGQGPYDPKTNYTTPRPEFLRYNPERRREILLRVEREMQEELELASSDSTAPSNSSSSSSSRGSDSECDELDAEEEVPHNGGWAKAARRLLLLLVALVSSVCYIWSMNPAPVPVSHEHLDFSGNNGSSVYEGKKGPAGVFMPIDMIGFKGVLEEATRGNVQAVSLQERKDFPGNFNAIEMLGLSDFCPDATLAAFACRIGDATIETVADPQELPELQGRSFENPELSEVAFLEGNFVGDSAGDSHTADMEETQLESLDQEEGECCSNRSMAQSVSMDKAKEFESEMLDEENDLEAEPLYDLSTAEAAKAMKALVEFWWSVLEPHWLQISVCLSGVAVLGIVAALYKYIQKSQKASVPRSHHLPVLHPAVLRKCPAPQPMQVPVLKPEPSIDLELSTMDDAYCSRNIQEVDVDGQKPSNSSVVDCKEPVGSKPPVVELLGEFSFVDAATSRARFMKDLNVNSGGDSSVKEWKVSQGGDAFKRQEVATAVQSHSVPRPRKEQENAEKGEKKMDDVATPLRRSSRLRNRATSP